MANVGIHTLKRERLPSLKGFLELQEEVSSLKVTHTHRQRPRHTKLTGWKLGKEPLQIEHLNNSTSRTKLTCTAPPPTNRGRKS